RVQGASSVSTVGNDVYVFTTHGFGSNLFKVTLRHQIAGTWEAASTIVSDPWERAFDRVWSNSGATWTDLTHAAANTTSSDLKNPVTGSLFLLAGDALYAGMSQPFDYLFSALSNKPSGGLYAWEYWNGSAWTPLTLVETRGADFTKSAQVRFATAADW